MTKIQNGRWERRFMTNINDYMYHNCWILHKAHIMKRLAGSRKMTGNEHTDFMIKLCAQFLTKKPIRPELILDPFNLHLEVVCNRLDCHQVHTKRCQTSQVCITCKKPTCKYHLIGICHNCFRKTTVNE